MSKILLYHNTSLIIFDLLEFEDFIDKFNEWYHNYQPVNSLEYE